jgi:hypothetical protein
MTLVETQRGYDDTANLREMASGLVSRRFGSVDEAAKAVLAEDGGSNVDRLRRKFREQNWYERGLAEFIEAEIAQRGLIAKPRHIAWFERLKARFGGPVPSLDKVKDDARVLGAKLSPKGSVAFSILASTLLFAAVSSGHLSSEHALVVLLAGTFYSMIAWANKTSEDAQAKAAALHVAGLSLLTAGVTAMFALFMPTAGYLLGSLYGTLACAVGLTVIGVYITSFVSMRSRRAGRRTFEVASLIFAVALLSQSATVLLVHDTLAARAHPSDSIQAMR